MSIQIRRKDFFLRFLQTFLKHSLTLFIYYYSAYTLEPYQYGKAVYYISIAGLVLMFCDFGVSGSIIRFIAGNKNNPEFNEQKVITKVLIVLFALSILILGGFIVVMEFYKLPGVDDKKLIYILIPYILFSPLNAVFDGFLIGKREFDKLLKINIIYWPIAIFFIFLLVTNFGLVGVMWSFSFMAVLLFIIFVIFNLSQFDFLFRNISITEAFRYAIIIGIGSLSYFLYTRFDIFILEYFGYTKEIGHYEIINRIFTIIVIPFTIYSQVQSPIVAEYNSNKRNQDVIKHFKKIMFRTILLGLFIAFCCYTLIPKIVDFYLPQYASNDFFRINAILAGVLPLKLVGVVATNGFIAPIGKAKITTVVTLIFGVLNIILDIIFIRKYGFIGIFWATFVAHNLAIIIQLIIFSVDINKENVKENKQFL